MIQGALRFETCERCVGNGCERCYMGQLVYCRCCGDEIPSDGRAIVDIDRDLDAAQAAGACAACVTADDDLVKADTERAPAVGSAISCGCYSCRVEHGGQHDTSANCTGSQLLDHDTAPSGHFVDDPESEVA